MTEMMSSEESENEAIVVKELPWRSKKVDDFLWALDGEATKRKSEQAKRQTKH